MNKRYCIIFSFGLGMLNIALVTFLIIIFLVTRTYTKDEKKSFTYLYQELDLQSGETTYGFVQSPRILKEEDAITYRLKENSFAVVSNFGDRRFECTGECYQEIIDRRRSTVVSKSTLTSITFVISAFSISMALRISEKSMGDSCAAEFREIHNEEYIKSRFTCVEIEEKDLKANEKQDWRHGSYHCSGHCIRDSDEREAPENVKKMKDMYGTRLYDESLDKFGNCQNLKYERVLKNVEPWKEKGDDYNLPLMPGVKTKEEYVANVFQMFSLHPFCMKSSRVQVTEKTKHFILENENEFHKDDFEVGIPFCSGYRSSDSPLSSNIGNVKCVKI